MPLGPGSVFLFITVFCRLHCCTRKFCIYVQPWSSKNASTLQCFEFALGSQLCLHLVSVLVWPHLQPTLILQHVLRSESKRMRKHWLLTKEKGRMLKIPLFLMADKMSSKKSTSIKVLFIPTTTLWGRVIRAFEDEKTKSTLLVHGYTA